MKKYYLITSDNIYDNKVKIYNEEDIIFSDENIWLSRLYGKSRSFITPFDSFISDIILNNNNIVCDDLSYLTEKENKTILVWYERKTWENLFWILGYDIEGKSEENILSEIKNSTQNEILLYLQNIEVLLMYYNKGKYFKRFRLLYKKYQKLINENEKNKIVVEFTNETIKYWQLL